ncbi:hypothetical protein LQ564_05380 [Massilia sp. G4R7]|uniref:PASTA domain-containing protein n=1 Tax=Massilia phyllostachyos TaxID=2898585 RepID=A0ABS8Q1X0_9BURK|nr:hypothetical protein [Massilia phyllostachyos]MCD2515743.1 hypothetical protein [Massilia phyllostachyos]
MTRRALVLVVAVMLGGCSLFKSRPEPVRRPVPVAVKPAVPGLQDPNGTPIERVPFRTGVSSATVEKMAKEHGCLGGQGAGLMTEAGPVEVYRMRCESGAMQGKVLTARCELRQCVKM